MTIFIRILLFFVDKISVQWRNYYGITKRIDKFLYMRYEIGISNGPGIKLAIVHAESDCYAFLSYKQD